MNQIFLFGGASDANIDATINLLSHVYVLSLPGFNWQRTDQALPYGRITPTCSVINRQMIVVGGAVKTIADQNTFVNERYTSEVDPWHQGLGVFDLTDMAWMPSYDASAAAYVTPQMVKDYYTRNARYPASLQSDDLLKSWFSTECEYFIFDPSST